MGSPAGAASPTPQSWTVSVPLSLLGRKSLLEFRAPEATLEYGWQPWHRSLCVCMCVLSHVRLCGPVDCSPPGSSVRGIFQAKILEWVAISSSRGSSQPRTKPTPHVIFCIGKQILYHCTTWEAQNQAYSYLMYLAPNLVLYCRSILGTFL